MDRSVPPAPDRLLVATLALGAFAASLNVTMLSPLLPALGADLGASDAATGQLATATAAGAGLTAVAAVPWMERFSRRGWLRFEAALLLAGTLLSALAPGFGWLLAARVLAGVGGAVVYANCLAAAAELVPDPGRRNRLIGLLGTAATLGAVLGLPVLAQLSDAAGWRWAVAALLPPAALLLVGAGRLPGRAAGAGGPRWRGWGAGYRRVLGNGETVWLLGALLVQMAVWFGWLIYFGAFAEADHGADAGALGLLFLAAGGAQAAASNLVPPALRRFGPRVVTAALALALAADLLAVGIVYRSVWSLAPFVVVAGAASGGLFVCTSILLLDSFPAARGSVMALQSVGVQLGGAVGAAGVGAALTLLGGYAPAYRLLGLAAPLVLLGVGMSRRARATAARHPSSA